MLRYSVMHDLMAGTAVYKSFVTSALNRAVYLPLDPLTGLHLLRSGTVFGIST